MKEILKRIFSNRIQALPVNKQVIAGFGVLTSLLIVLAFTIFSLINQMSIRQLDVQKSFDLTKAINNSKHNLLQEQFIMMELLESDANFQVKDWKIEHEKAKNSIQSNLHSIHTIANQKNWGNDFLRRKKLLVNNMIQIEKTYKTKLLILLEKQIELTNEKIQLKQNEKQNISEILKNKNISSEIDTQYDYISISSNRILNIEENIIERMLHHASESSSKFTNYAYSIIIILAIFCLFIAFYFGNSIIKRLNHILGEDPLIVSSYLDNLAKGNIQFDFNKKENATGLLKSIEQLIENFKEKITIAENVGNGNFEDNIHLSSKNDHFGIALQNMINNIKENQNQIKSLTTIQKSILNSTEQSIISTNLEGTIIAFNKAAEKMLGYSSEELINQTSPAIFHDLNEVVEYAEILSLEYETTIIPGFEVFIHKAVKNGFDKREWTYIDKNGLKFPIELTTSPILDFENKIIGYTGVASDIRMRKEYEEQLIKSKEIAENLAKAKDEFMSSMSHEIRTPLNGILGFTNLLLTDKKLNTEQRQQIETIKISGDILLVIINDILDIAKIESGKLSIEQAPVNLRALTENIVNTFNVKIDEKKIKLKTIIDNSIPEFVLTDSVRISQILLNFISNAVKFTPENGIISVEATQVFEDDDISKVKFSITDSGIGIPEDKIDSIFDAFVQTSDDTARKYGGTGLGLTIVKKITELLEGEIYVESELGKSAKFTVILSLKKINSINNKENIVFSIKDLKILLVEDNAINQLLAQTVLAQFETIVTTAENGLIALDYYRENDFDIILMDLMMPELDGYQTTIEIRSLDDQVKKDIPIIALTADVTNSVITKCKEAGMNDYISKPFDGNELKNKILTLINRRDENN